MLINKRTLSILIISLHFHTFIYRYAKSYINRKFGGMGYSFLLLINMKINIIWRILSKHNFLRARKETFLSLVSSAFVLINYEGKSQIEYNYINCWNNFSKTKVHVNSIANLMTKKKREREFLLHKYLNEYSS